MKFYNRLEELKYLQKIQKLSEKSGQMTVVIGRRRIGKTTLIKKAYEKRVYFFISKKDESLLCLEFVNIVQNSLDIKIFGEFKKFKNLFEYLLEISKSKNFTLIIDEFQEFLHINPSIYSDMQNLWDEYKDESKMNLILSGSIYSMMKKIFEDKKEPLFGRANHKIHLKAFSVATLKEILEDNSPSFSNYDLLSFYIFTGGVAKYVELFVANGAFTLQKQLDLIFNDFSLFLEEGKNLLIEEFGKDYTSYFSILALISQGKTSRSEMESILGKSIGGYLQNLELDYSLIQKIRPIFSKSNGRVVKYKIVDNYLNFWFRFIFKYKSAIEIENFEYVKQIVKRDFDMYSGLFLEKYFMNKFKIEKKYSQIGNYWEKGNQNEIDIIAVNELEKSITFAEVKLNKNKINLKKLKEKSHKISNKFLSYKTHFIGLSLEDM